MTDEQAAKIIAYITAAYPKTNITEATIEIYMEFLTAMDFEATNAAVRRILKTNQFFPTIAEITNAVEKLNPDQLPQADQAWSEVMTQIRKVGHCGIPQFSHDSIREAVKAIGWMNLCTSESIGIERAHFMKIYDAVKGRHKDNQINQEVLKLVGGLKMIAP